MGNVSLLARFLDHFLKGLIPTLKEIVLDAVLALVTVVYQFQHGRLSFQAWEENLWEAVTPWTCLLCCVALWHVVKAARSLDREIRQGLYQSKKPFIILTDGEPASISPNYQLKLAGIVVLCALFLFALPYLSWHAAQRITDSGAFSVSDGSLSFVNMSQSLATKGSGWWWVTYRSYAGDTASPVALAQYIEVTNLLPTPETIKNYSVAIYTEDCGWTYLSPISLASTSVWFTYQGLDNAFQVDFRGNGLDYILQKPIPANGTIAGSWFFDSKVKCDAPEGSKIRYRISLSTFSGIKFEYTTPEMTVSNKAFGPGNTEGRTKYPEFVIPPNAKGDISKFYRRLWSSPIPAS